MIARWLILIGKSEDAVNAMFQSTPVGPIQKISHSGSEIRLLHSDADQTLILPNGKGFIVGTLFPRFGPHRAISRDDSTELNRIAAGGHGEFLQRYWGSYIAVFCEGRGVTVIRDPSGSQPCYYLDKPGGIALTSDVGILVRYGALVPTIAWEEIPRYLCAKDLPSEKTALVGVRELLAGTALVHHFDKQEVLEIWSPRNHITPLHDWSASEAAELLRRTVQNCATAWRSRFDLPLLMLSGGLDSSVVACCMQKAGARVSSMTVTSGDGFGDERQYAQMMAQAVGSDLFATNLSIEDIDLSRSVAEHFPKPIGAAHESALLKAIIRRSREIGADHVLTGNGGDNVFYNSSSVRPFFDRLYDPKGWTGAFSTLHDISQVTGTTPAKVARAIIAFWRKAQFPYVWTKETDLLTPDAKFETRNLWLRHSWLDSPYRIPVGKQGHIAMLLRMQNHIEGYLRPFDLPIINPLTSQPIVELALSVPTWRQIEGGRNRAVVRRAFANALPESIACRTGKGSPSGFAMSIFRMKSDEIRERLMEGPLAQRNYINCNEILGALDKGSAMGLSYMRLLAFLDLQAWIEHWRSSSTTSVALPLLETRSR